MTAPLVFLDTETTGVHPGRRPWEIAMIRRDDAGERTLVLQVEDVDLTEADPFGLRVGRFYDRHVRYSAKGKADQFVTEAGAARWVEHWTRGAHIVGAVPNFDTETLDAMLRRHRLLPAWHYHPVDVENLAVGYLRGLLSVESLLPPGRAEQLRAVLTPPWSSEELSRECGVEPAADEERHTALGDARWAMRLYDAISGGAQ